MSFQITSACCTPNGLEVAIWYYVRCEPHPRRTTPAVQEAINDLLYHDLMIADNDAFAGSGYKFTDKGFTWMEMLCSTPLPVSRPVRSWIDPRLSVSQVREAIGLESL